MRRSAKAPHTLVAMTMFFIACSESVEPTDPIGGGRDAADADASADAGMDSGEDGSVFVVDVGFVDAGPADAGFADTGVRLDSGCGAATGPSRAEFTELTPAPLTVPQSARLPDGQVLVTGASVTATNAAIFDPSTDTFASAPSRPDQGILAATLSLPDGRVVALGNVARPVAVFDGQWRTSRTTVPSRGTPIALADGRILLVGGADIGITEATRDMYVFDPDADTWRSTSPLLTPRFGAMVAQLIDGRVLIAGGGVRQAMLRTTELWDPVTETSTPGPDMNAVRSNGTALLMLDGRVVVVGGEAIDQNVRTEIYDPALDRFLPIFSTSDPTPFGGVTTLLCDGRVAHLSGRFGGLPFNPVPAFLFDPETGAWTQTTARLPARQFMAASVLADGRVLLTGGAVFGQAPDPSAWLFVPDVSTF